MQINHHQLYQLSKIVSAEKSPIIKKLKNYKHFNYTFSQPVNEIQLTLVDHNNQKEWSVIKLRKQSIIKNSESYGFELDDL